MSLINKMLQNLEERKNIPESSTSPKPVYEDLRPVKLPRVRARGRMGVVLLLLGGAGVGYYAWTQWGDGFFADPESPIQASQTAVAVAKPAKPKPVQEQPAVSSVPAPEPRVAAAAPPAEGVEGRAVHEAEEAKEAVEPAAVPQEPPAVVSASKVVAEVEEEGKQTSAPPGPGQSAQTTGGYYTVVKGDSLYGIAAKTGHRYEELAAWNNIDPPYTIYAGQRLRLSPSGQLPAAATKTAATSSTQKDTASAVVRDDGGATGSGVLEKKVTPLTVEQKAENHYRQAARYLQQGRLGDAEARLRSALAVNPRHAKAREVLVGLSLRNGRWREAKQLLEEGIKKAPRYYPFVQLLARIHVEQGTDQQALQLMEGAQQAAHSDGEYMAFLATLYQRAGRHADAVKAFKRAISLRPEAGRWWLGLGISLEAEENWGEAIKAYTRARYSGSLTPKLIRYVERRIAAIEDK